MTTFLRAFACLVALALFAAPASAQEKVRLELRLKKGQTFVQTTDSTQKITQSIQGIDQTIDQVIGFTMTNTVLDVDSAGIATVEIKYDAVRWSQASPVGKQTYDSSKDKEATGPAKAFAALVGSKLTAKMDKAGKVTDLKGVDELVKHVMDAVELPPGPQGDMAREQMKNQFSDATMKQGIENISAVYPDAPVGVGDTWKKKVAVDIGMQMVVETTYKLKERKNGIAIIEATSKVTPPEKIKGIAMGKMKMIMSVSGTQSGVLHIEEQSGQPTKSDVEQDLAGSMVLADENGNQVLSIPMAIKSKTDMSTSSPK